MRVIPSTEVVFRPVRDEGVLLDLRDNVLFTLNDTGVRVWQLLEQHQQMDAVVQQMVEEFEVSEAQVRSDVEALVEQLKEASLVTVEGKP